MLVPAIARKVELEHMHGRYHNEYIYEIVRGDDDDQP
jgi:hypothetical protein